MSEPTRLNRNPLRRYYGRGDLHFIIFSCYRRRAYLGRVRARDRFVKALDVVRKKHKFLLVGYVVMPEHVHLLISEPERGDPSKVLQVLKQKISRELRRRRRGSLAQFRLGFPEREPESPAFWQRRFYDFNVWSAKKLREKLDYMHANPIERGLASHPKDWPWSSWSYYEKGEQGLIRIDTLGDEPVTEKAKPGRRKKRQNPHP